LNTNFWRQKCLAYGILKRKNNDDECLNFWKFCGSLSNVLVQFSIDAFLRAKKVWEILLLGVGSFTSDVHVLRSSGSYTLNKKIQTWLIKVHKHDPWVFREASFNIWQARRQRGIRGQIPLLIEKFLQFSRGFDKKFQK